MTVRTDPTATIEEAVQLGDGTAVWDHVHIRHGACLGLQCIVGGKSYIAYDVKIGNRVKINSFVYICHGVTIEDGVMIGAGTIFTNDRFPRACSPDLQQLRTSEPDEHTLLTRVGAGASIGAGCVIGADLEVGSFAMVGMGSVVTQSVAPFHLVFGNPARSFGAVCRCGHPVARWESGERADIHMSDARCERCGDAYSIQGGQVLRRD